ncbi:hypothetical protein G6F68_021499 [Rhizopus microsporus]|nr:hypothetical protein G6F68_021499 [Rhizopus microsporus]
MPQHPQLAVLCTTAMGSAGSIVAGPALMGAAGACPAGDAALASSAARAQAAVASPVPSSRPGERARVMG